MKHFLNIYLRSLSLFQIAVWSLILGILLIVPNSLIAQKAETTAIDVVLLNTLTENIAKGDLIAFRDLAKLYDTYPKDEKVQQLLRQHTCLTQEEWQWTTNSTKAFTPFFYEYADSFRFSELLQVFYLTPIEKRATTAQISPKKIGQVDPFFIRASMQKMGGLLHQKKVPALLKEIEILGKTNNTAVSEILSDLLDRKELYKLAKPDLANVFDKVLVFLPDSIAYQKLLNHTQKGRLPIAFCRSVLANLSNNYFPAETHQELYLAHQKLGASFEQDLALIKAYGYQKVKLTPALFFEESVDYFGWMVATCPDSLSWIRRNGILDMLATKHPKSLFYIAGLNYKHWKATGENDEKLLVLIEKYIDVSIKIPERGDWRTYPLTEEGQVHFINYWSIHYDDFEWDAYVKKFVNQQLFADELEAYDRYFRRLNSVNDTIAQMAFVELTKGKPNEIKKLLKKFKPLLRNYNVSLPPLKYKILEQISELSQFCQQHNFSYQPSTTLESILEKLMGRITPKERIKLENELKETLTVDDITTLEYFAAIHAQYLDLNYSIGRVLNYLYQENWSFILDHEDHFRLYLLKIELFQGLGGFGVCKKYANHIDLHHSKIDQLLKSLDRLETDPIIRSSLDKLLDQRAANSAEQIAQFLANPKTIDKASLKRLPPFDTAKVLEIVQELFLQEDKKATQNIGSYLELYASVDMIPQFFATPQKQWVANKYAGKALVKVLEKIYQYSFDTKEKASIMKWWDLWRTNPIDYREWSKLLFEQQLVLLKSGNDLTIKDINKVSASPYYEEKYRKLCLESLKKVKKTRTIYRLQLSPKVSVKAELSYLESFSFSAKDLGNLPKMFEVDDATQLLDFIYEQSVSATLEEKSALYNKLFRQAWFFDHITKGAIAGDKYSAIKLIFYQYLSKSTFLTEYEEQATQLNIVHLENAYLSLTEKLERIASDSLNDNIRFDYLNATVSRMEFPDILLAFPILNKISIPNKNLFQFLNRDFGLPIFNLDKSADAEQVVQQLRTLSENEFYEKTLVNFGLPILTKKGQLNFNKIYELLAYDLVVPFLGDGGKYRDYYNYGLVKLLELHFKTTLGFHPKLNENQTFYTFNSYKRVEAWREYLVDNGLVKARVVPFFE